ncbi:MAG: zf-HC2 domain-containing protein [Firmicutes bacterium]|nr:zf-HC2 domain-containing protein [Bacillota bacterium]
MHCQEVLEMLSPYLDGVLDPAEHAAVQDHLACCPSCSAELEELRSCLSLLQELPDVAPPAGFRAGLMVKIDTLSLPTQAPQRKSWFEHVNGVSRKGWYRTAAVAAVMAMTLGLTALWEKEGHQFIPVQPTAQEMASAEQLTAGDRQENRENNPSKPADNTVPGVEGEKPHASVQAGKETTKPADKAGAPKTAGPSERQLVFENYHYQPSEGMTVRTVVLKLDVQDAGAALKSIGAISQKAGGSIVAPYTENSDSGTVGIKVPAHQSRAVENQLKALGEVVTDMPTVRDLSSQHRHAVDVLEQLKAEQTKLANKLAEKEDPALEDQLASITAAMTQQIKLIQQIEEQCSDSTITITLQ